MYDAWLRSGIYGSASYVYLLDSSGALGNDLTDLRYAVRPALLDCDKLKKPRISRTFGAMVHIRRAGCVPVV